MTTTPISSAVTGAVQEVQETFAESAVTVTATGDGGAWVVIDPIPLSSTYAQDSSWIAFLITFAYPEADVYPHFVRPDLKRTDGAALGEGGFSPTTWGGPAGGEPGMQLSRRSNRLNLPSTRPRPKS